MKEIQKTAIKILILIADICLLAFRVIMQINLPNLKRKGNLFSSLFIFFTGLIELLNLFEYGFLNMAVLFRKKYVRQTILIIAGILFILSTSEETGKHLFAENTENIHNLHCSSGETAKEAIVEYKYKSEVSFPDKPGLSFQHVEYISPRLTPFLVSSGTKIFLNTRSIRI